MLTPLTLNPAIPAAQVVLQTAQETLRILKIVIPAIFFGLLASSYVYAIPVFRDVVKAIARFTMKFGLKSGSAVAAFLIHPVAAYSLLAELHRNGKIDDREVIIATLVGTFSRTLRLTILFLIPIAVPTLGIWGIYYVLLVLLTRGVVSLIGLTIARKTLNAGELREIEIPRISLKETLRRFVRVATTLSMTIFAVMLLFNLFNPKDYFSNVLPAASMIVVATGFPSMLAAIATAGSLLAKGLLSGKQLLISLFLASIAHSFVEVSRNTFPTAASIMGKNLGFKVAICTLLSRIFANLLAIILILL